MVNMSIPGSTNNGCFNPLVYLHENSQRVLRFMMWQYRMASTPYRAHTFLFFMAGRPGGLVVTLEYH